jgi:integrase
MRGFVRKRGSTYTWYFDVPDPVMGKRRQYSKGGFRTKRECQQALNEALSTLRTGTFVEPSQRSVAGFLVEEWLPAMRPPRVRPSTWLSYRKNVERHIVPALGHVPLQRLTPAQLTAFYRGLLESGHRRGSGLTPKTVRNIHGALHAALRDAVRWGFVARNVATAADLPKSTTPEMRVWRPEQLRAFLDQVRDDRLYAAWLLLATTGMRRGEVAGLRWVDVDLDAARVSPRRPRVVVNHQVLVSEPKTTKGRRSIALDPATVAALREHRRWQLEKRLAVGPGAGRTRGWCSPGRTVGRYTQSGSPNGSSSTPEPPGCRGSGCTTSATVTPPPPWPPGFRPRSSASGSDTPTSPSPWTPIVTCCPAWTSWRPARWPS